MSPDYASAALANLDDAIASLRAAMTARTNGGSWALVVKAQAQAVTARAKLVDALGCDEANEEEAAAQ